MKNAKEHDASEFGNSIKRLKHVHRCWNASSQTITKKITKQKHWCVVMKFWWIFGCFFVWLLLAVIVSIMIGDVRTLGYEQIAFRLEFRLAMAEYATTTHQKGENRNFLSKANLPLTLLPRRRSAAMSLQAEEQNDFIVSIVIAAPDYVCNLCSSGSHRNVFGKKCEILLVPEEVRLNSVRELSVSEQKEMDKWTRKIFFPEYFWCFAFSSIQAPQPIYLAVYILLLMPQMQMQNKRKLFRSIIEYTPQHRNKITTSK